MLRKLVVACALVPLFPGLGIADDAGKQSAGEWNVSYVGGFADLGQSNRGAVAFVLPSGARHFLLKLDPVRVQEGKAQATSVLVAFSGGNNYFLSGTREGSALALPIPDQQIAQWTHDFTAQSEMTISFPGTSEPYWFISLNGTTPTITAMAKAIEMAGITGLPAPWTVSAATPVAPTQLAPPSLPTRMAHADCIAAGRPAWVNGILSPDAAVQRQQSCEQGYIDREKAAQREQEAKQAALAAAQEQSRLQTEAENSPENHCRDPGFAGEMIDQLNQMRSDSYLNGKVVDIEHLTTLQWDSDKQVYQCRGTLVLNYGARTSGVYSAHLNVAGQMLTQWFPGR